ncbi:deacylase [Haladaptatus pallidirubidus]|uniref:Succinylglutamate desuccinylase / Aspartoacylase family protein n=1 Tax=Haladaptatus pallidirubidus TaxID=1008152 RepID=A0AAV3UI68_9EURY|nr:deacylase [Haladaptatus pallidirubidus]
MTKSAGIAAFSTLGVSQVGKVLGDDDEFCPIRQSHSKETILEGTKEEVEVHTTESRIPGPTAVVVGGLQGIEPATWQTVYDVHDWSINSGKLVLLPEANPVAIRNNTYINENGDLNDQFPPGRTPKTKLAQALWEVIEEADPDVFISLHSSHGILWEREGPNGVGQAIYPTYVDGAREDARRTVEYMNQRLDSFRSLYDFKVGNTLHGIRPLLTHKVAADLQIPGFLIEATRYGTNLATRVQWEKAIVAHLLEQNGMGIKQ